MMKKFGCALFILALFSCNQGNRQDEGNGLSALVKEYDHFKAKETNTRQFIENYIKDLNSSQWKSKVPKYLKSDADKFLEEHTAFRTSFPNYRATIKHLIVDGDKAIVWLHVTANYASNYRFEGGDGIDDPMKGMEAKNQPLSWDETWYFNVIDGKFGDQWDFLKDQYTVLRGMGMFE